MIIGLSIVLMIVGIGILLWGVSANRAFNAPKPRFFIGSLTNKAVLIMSGGGLAAIAGVFGLILGLR